MKILKMWANQFMLKEGDKKGWFDVSEEECLAFSEGTGFFEKGTVLGMLRVGNEVRTPSAVYKIAEPLDPSLRWYHNAKTGEIDFYHVSGELTDFPKGVLYAYGDYVTMGLKSKEEAEKWAREWSACLRCKAVRSGKPGDECKFCGDVLVASNKDCKLAEPKV